MNINEVDSFEDDVFFGSGDWCSSWRRQHWGNTDWRQLSSVEFFFMKI